jgi:hypothetical protein
MASSGNESGFAGHLNAPHFSFALRAAENERALAQDELAPRVGGETG